MHIQPAKTVHAASILLCYTNTHQFPPTQNTKPNPCFNKSHKLWCGQVYPNPKQQTDKTSDTRRALTARLLCNLNELASALLTFSFIVLNKTSKLSILTRMVHRGQKTLKGNNYATLEGTANGGSRPLTRNCFFLVSTMEKEKN